MGLSDRDYARSPDSQPPTRSGRRARGGPDLYAEEHIRLRPRLTRPTGSPLAALRTVSFNTWLIVANVAVFVVMALTPRLVTLAPFGDFPRDATVSPRELAGAMVDLGQRATAVRPGVPAVPGQVVCPLLKREPAGRDPVTGQPYYELVGYRVLQPMHTFTAFGHFSTARLFFGWEVWRVLTFQFLHANVTHLILNMLGLWFFGSMVEKLLGSKRYAAFYLTCGIFGAVLYLVLNSLGNLAVYAGLPYKVPGLLFDSVYMPLVGASAGIFGVLLAAAFIAPRAIIYAFFVLPLRLRTAVYLFFGIALINLLRDTSNSGGEAAHVGGALAGAFFIRRMHLLRDFFDVFGDSRRARPGAGPSGAMAAGAEVDRVLAKVHATGLSSLTEGEKETLRRASEGGGGGVGRGAGGPFG
jgi:membrane associated rhomboid family serine protease